MSMSEGAEIAYPMTSAAAASRYEPSIATAGDYLALMKPRVMSLVVFTAFVGMVIAPAHIHPVIGLAGLVCISVLGFRFVNWTRALCWVGTLAH